METIKYSDIDFNFLEEISKTKRSTVYTEKGLKENIYKILNYKTKEELIRKRKKLEILSQIEMPSSVVMPNKLIQGNNKLKGIITTYIDGITLCDLSQYKDFDTYLYVILNVSKDMRRIHDLYGKPIIGDMHFDNILVDFNFNHYFIDVDSYGILGIREDDISNSLSQYLSYMNYNNQASSNTDRISFMLSFFNNIFNNHILGVDEYEYDEYAEKNKILKQLKDIFLELKMSYSSIPEIPYMHELIR